MFLILTQHDLFISAQKFAKSVSLDESRTLTTRKSYGSLRKQRSQKEQKMMYQITYRKNNEKNYEKKK
jgi:hypothetical protein